MWWMWIVGWIVASPVAAVPFCMMIAARDRYTANEPR